MTNFQYLKKNYTIDIVATAGKSDADVLHKIAELITSWGLQSNIPDNILGEDLLCANSDAIRFALLQDALFNTASKAIWCMRGGYGSMRLIPMLEKLTPPKQQKLFIGFSDITALHIFLQEKWGWQTFHGSSAQQIVKDLVDQNSASQVKDLLLGKTQEVKFANLIPLNTAAKTIKKINAPIVGGNLTLVECSLATSWQLTTKNKILFLEDVNMPGYQIDRSLVHLQQAGLFKDVAAVLLGDFIGRDAEKDAELIEKTLNRFANELDIPVFKIPNIGHGKINYVLPLGMPAELQLNNINIKCNSPGRFPVIASGTPRSNPVLYSLA